MQQTIGSVCDRCASPVAKSASKNAGRVFKREVFRSEMFIPSELPRIYFGRIRRTPINYRARVVYIQSFVETIPPQRSHEQSLSRGLGTFNSGGRFTVIFLRCLLDPISHRGMMNPPLLIAQDSFSHEAWEIGEWTPARYCSASARLEDGGRISRAAAWGSSRPMKGPMKEL